jgi:SAM-dependent methyltransferase
MTARGKWQGVATIVRLNWPLYAGAAAVLIGSAASLLFVASPTVKLVSAFALIAALYFLLGSLGVSHWIYDRSDLYRWRWLSRALANSPRSRIVFCHSGFDEASCALRQELDAEWIILDHYDDMQMTEPSIRRARRMFPPVPGTVPAAFGAWPIAPNSCDVVFGLLAIHELRRESDRVAWFAQAKRALRDKGRVVLVEHARDFANFIAFGPGFLHFHSPGNWRRCWEQSGLRLLDEFRVTPWIRIFVLVPSESRSPRRAC